MYKKFLADTRGNFATIFAIASVPVMLVAGAAVDYSDLSDRRSNLQGSVDAAILSVGQDFLDKTEAEIRAQLNDYLKSNLSPDQFARIAALNIDIDPTNYTLTVTADGQSDPHFMKLAGISKLDYRAISQIKAPFGGLEIALVLDNTGSMNNDNKIDDLKSAAHGFVDEMMVKPSGGKVKIGLVPFADYVNVGLSERHESWLSVADDTATSIWNGCVGSREHPFNIQDGTYGSRTVPGVHNVACGSSIMPMTNYRQGVKDNIDAMVANGDTFIPGGLSWGMRLLSSQKPFQGGASPAYAASKNISKFIILMTDGSNTVSPDPLNPASHLGTDVALANTLTLESCGEIKSEDISIFTISFGTLADETKTMLETCASSAANYYHAADGTVLKKAFDDIKDKLSALHLSM